MGSVFRLFVLASYALSPSWFFGESPRPSPSSCFIVSALSVPGAGSASSKASSPDKIDCLIDYSKGYKNAANIYSCSARQKCCLEYGKVSHHVNSGQFGQESFEEVLKSNFIFPHGPPATAATPNCHPRTASNHHHGRNITFQSQSPSS